MLLFVLVYADFDLRDVSYLDYLFVSLDYMLDFLKFAGIRMYPRACGYPRVAGTGIILYPWRVAGAGAGTCFDSRVRIYQVCIRADFTRCHPYHQPIDLYYSYLP